MCVAVKCISACLHSLGVCVSNLTCLPLTRIPTCCIHLAENMWKNMNGNRESSCEIKHSYLLCCCNEYESKPLTFGPSKHVASLWIRQADTRHYKHGLHHTRRDLYINLERIRGTAEPSQITAGHEKIRPPNKLFSQCWFSLKHASVSHSKRVR